MRVKSSEHKLELFKNTQVVDISKISISSHNLKRSVNLMRKEDFQSFFMSVKQYEKSAFTECVELDFSYKSDVNHM